jgi:DNA-binding NarL/FixJ family response regulator
VPSPVVTHDVLIQDPHAPSRLGLGVLLRAQPWVGQCHLAADLPTALGLIRTHRPDVALVDMSSSGPFAGHHCETLRRAHTGLAIVLTARCAQVAGAGGSGARVARDAGAAAYLAPDASAAEIVGAVRAVAQGVAVPEGPDRDGTALTARELEVLQLLATGATNREIASELHLSTDAIKKYSSALYRKLGVRNRTEAAALVAG